MNVSHFPEKPLIIFDGECGFCRRWINRWIVFTDSRVDYDTAQKMGAIYPEIEKESFERSIQLIETDGNVYEGAEAVFRALSYAPGKTWLLGLYQKVSGFRALSEFFYRLVASHRVFFSNLTRFLWGDDLNPSTYRFAAQLFIKLMGVIYLFSFLSLASQILGLVGSKGILSAKEYLTLLHANYGSGAYFHVPTLFWFDASDLVLQTVCWTGVAGSLLVIGGISPAPVLFILWVLYLSLLNAGQDFMSFQWDNLLLESGFLSIFLASWRPGGKNDPVFRGFNASNLIRLLLYFLLFRLMFFSGMMKLRSGDPNWSHLTALTYHYQTQPLPTGAAWYFHFLPVGFHQFSALVMFGVELLAPFLIWGPRRLRSYAAAAITALQVLIMLTGNYCFFNLLTIVLCVPLIDDQTWPASCLYFFQSLEKRTPFSKNYGWPKWVVGTVAATALLGTLNQVPAILNFSIPALTIPSNILRPLRSFNQYGLFSVMTTERPEIIIEGSNNRITWKAYEFQYKPGDVMRRPGFNLPHQPRLDWQMWFAALGSYKEHPWFAGFCEKLLKGSPDVLRLLKNNPFPDDPPRYIQATLYDYHFADPQTHKKTGAWWVRERRSLYAPVVSLRNRA